MKGIVRDKLMVRVVLTRTLIALIPVVVVTALSYVCAVRMLEDRALTELETTADRMARTVTAYLDQTTADLRFLAQTSPVSAPLSNPAPTGEAALKEMVSSAIGAKWLALSGRKRGVQELLISLIQPDGRIELVGTIRGPESSASPERARVDATLAELGRIILQSKKPAVLQPDSAGSSPAENLFVGVPIPDGASRVAGVLAARVNTNRLTAVLKPIEDLGTTAGATLVGKNGVIAALQAQSGTDESPLVTDSLLGKTNKRQAGSGTFESPSGADMLMAWNPVDVSSRTDIAGTADWTVITRMSRSQAVAPMMEPAAIILGATLLVTIVVAALGLAVASPFVESVRRLAQAAAAVSAGDLTVEIPKSSRPDELGKLIRAFGEMVEGLRTHIGMVMEGVTVLATSASEISATVSQLAVSSSNTASAVNQTSTTINEVKQAANVSKDQARKVAESAGKVASVSQSGFEAAQMTLDRMRRIKDQMGSVGETVIKLNENSEAVEEIIGAVQDLADQSNLLAVNASIEASRAGEHGRGFGVVAQEIKNLANQSRESTQQVRTILEDTRQSINAVVTAAEEGNRSVEAGLEQSATAGESIRSLTDAVSEASQSAEVIVASTEQQFIGVDQVSSAMESIKNAMEQNLSGTTQLESEARRLDDLGQTLKELAMKYRT